jgi:hypothetical protein
MYHDVLGDPKVQRLAIELRWRWVELLCIASKSKTRGDLPDVEDIAYMMRVPRPRAQQIVEAMIANHLIDAVEGQPLRIHDWDHHQRSSDGSADRVRRYRERNGSVTGNVTSNGHVTLQKRSRVRPRAGADSETDTEKEESPSHPPKGANGFALPDWIPSEDWDSFIEMRRKIGKRLTDAGKPLAVKKLAKLRDEGNDPGEVLRQSVLGSWQGLFEVKGGDRNGHSPRRPEPVIKIHRKGDPL